MLSSSCCFSIAGIGVQLVCDDVRLGGALQERYRAFLSNDSPRLMLHIGVAGSDQSLHPALADLDICGNVVRQPTPLGTSYIDVETGQGCVIVPLDHALEAVEYWLRVAYALLAFRAGGLLFHAAGIVRDGRAYLFCGRSGSGKTTVARLSPNDIVLNDDLVVLLPRDGRWIAHATPFSNPTQVQPAGAGCGPLAAILRLVQDTSVAVRQIDGGLALAELLANVPVLSADPALGDALFLRCQQLLGAVPVHYLHFLPDASFWPVVEALVAHGPGQTSE